MMTSVEQLPHQMVRDLSWVFSSPALIHPSQLSFKQNPLDEKWLREIARSPDLINNFMVDKNLKMLGPYFEALWEFYFLNYPNEKLIAKNLQVFSSNKTIGEFDFIFLNEETGKYCHLEVAVKYFLGLETNPNDVNDDVINVDKAIQEQKNELDGYSPMSQWIGPNANDRLDKKYHKMVKQQSQLSKTPEGKLALEEFGIFTSNEAIKTEVCLLGYLFYPLDEADGKAMLPPENSHANHNKGYWLRVSQLEVLLPNEELWQLVDKPFWMAPLQQTRQQLKTRDEIINFIQQKLLNNQRPLLISSFVKSNENNFAEYTSDRKYFVVHDRWPEK